jgi:hypothetical protein
VKWTSLQKPRQADKHHEQPHIHKFTNISHQFCERHNPPKLTQEEIDSLHRPVPTKGESIINNIPKKTEKAKMGLQANFVKLDERNDHTSL